MAAWVQQAPLGAALANAKDAHGAAAAHPSPSPAPPAAPSRFGGDSALDRVPNELLDMVLQSVPDLPTLLRLLHASPHMNALFDAHPLLILRPVLARVAPHTRAIVRLVCHLRCLPGGGAAAAGPQPLDEFLEQHLDADKPGSAARDDASLARAPLPVLRAVVALDAKIDCLARALLANYMRRCQMLVPAGDVDPDPDLADATRAAGPCGPTTCELDAARQAFWRIQLFLEMHNAHAAGLLAWSDDESWGAQMHPEPEEEAQDAEDGEVEPPRSLGLMDVEFWGLPGTVPENNVWVGPLAGTESQLEQALSFVRLGLRFDLPRIRPSPQHLDSGRAELPWPSKKQLSAHWTYNRNVSLGGVNAQPLGSLFWSPERLEALGLTDPVSLEKNDVEDSDSGEEEEEDNESEEDDCEDEFDATDTEVA